MTDLRQRLQGALTGRYEVVREVGRGGMAIVYRARDLRHERDVALKVLRPELAATLGPERFLQEIRVAAGLAHPHILPLHDSGDADGCLYYVMPFVAGESLRDRLVREGPLPLDEALTIAREVADALAYAHTAGIVHRDIKPENILLLAGHAAVSDFGIARAISAAGSRRMTSQGIAVGTPDYMSPEQATAGDEVDGRSDIYSLGCVLFEMLTGQPPAWPTPPEGTGAGPARVRDRRSELAALRPTISVEIGDAIERALASAPADRFQTAAEFAAALAVPTGVYTPRSVVARRRRRIGYGLAAAALFGALAVALLPKVFGAGLDRSLYVVLPFGHRNGAAPALLDGDQCESALYDAFSRWSDVRVVGEPRAHDAWLRRRDNARTFFIWEGVTQYLTEDAVRATLVALQPAATGSRLAFTYVRRDFIEGTNVYDASILYKRFRQRQQVWRFGLEPDAVSNFVAEYGWRLVEQAGPDYFVRNYIEPAGRDLTASQLEWSAYAEKPGLPISP